MLSTLLFALGVAIMLFFVSNFLFDRYIDKKYLSEEAKNSRIEEYKNDLQNYVTENGLSCDDTKKISEWAKNNKYLYLLIYKDDQLLFESGQYGEDEEKKDPEMGENKENADDGTDNSVDNNIEDPSNTEGSEGTNGASGDGSEESVESTTKDEVAGDGREDNKYPSTGITVKTPTREELIAEAVTRGSHPIIASDGVLLASMVDYTEYFYYDLFNIVSIIISFVSIVFVMWFYFFEITKRITRLGREVTAVADGDMDRTITSEGEDEITRLCTDVEYMRSSMLENIEKERAALEANRDLITAMSHDIRTPLTVLLGYIDIMKLNSHDAEMQQYIEASERTALRLKKMSDDMFGYFLVYGGGIEVEVQECEAKTLIDQMLSGHVFLLREQGYDIDFNFEREDNSFLENVTVVTDPPQLMRIVENLFSNVMKYADKEKTVSVFVGLETDEMTIKVSNYIASNPDMAQKNGIGLRSCMKLANAMDIRFSSEEKDGVFTSLMCVPIIPIVEYKDTETEEGKRGFGQWLSSIFTKCKSFFAKTWDKIKDFITRKE